MQEIRIGCGKGGLVVVGSKVEAVGGHLLEAWSN